MSEPVIIVTGSRKWVDHRVIWHVLSEREPELVVHGGAPGADRHAEQWAHAFEVDSYAIRARWRRDADAHATPWRLPKARGGPYDPASGHRRNARMLDAYPKALVLAFPLDGPGTAGCIALAIKRGMRIEIFARDGSRIEG
jgi:hypothetical protein